MTVEVPGAIKGRIMSWQNVYIICRMFHLISRIGTYKGRELAPFRQLAPHSGDGKGRD
jgi:hypothetical protein